MVHHSRGHLSRLAPRDVGLLSQQLRNQQVPVDLILMVSAHGGRAWWFTITWGLNHRKVLVNKTSYLNDSHFLIRLLYTNIPINPISFSLYVSFSIVRSSTIVFVYFACSLIVMVCDMSNFLLNEYEWMLQQPYTDQLDDALKLSVD